MSRSWQNDPYIKKMAIVGEQNWEQQALVFSAKMVRRFPIQYFQPQEIDLIALETITASRRTAIPESVCAWLYFRQLS